eukprot:760249-Amphidinium_carterae.1
MRGQQHFKEAYDIQNIFPRRVPKSNTYIGSRPNSCECGMIWLVPVASARPHVYFCKFIRTASTW